MRIAVFTDSFYPELGGIQDSVLCTCRALGARGHQVVIYAPAASPSDFRLAGVEEGEIALGQNVRVRRLFSVPVPSSTGQSRLLLPNGRRWRELLAFRPDIIHSHTFLGAGWEAVRAARRLKVPIVGTNHWAIGEFGAYTPFSAELFRRASVSLVTWFYNRCSLVTAPSSTVLEEMQTFGLRRPHQVVSNPIDTELFQPASLEKRQSLKLKLGFSDTTILYAGRLASEKNIDILIRAFARLLPKVPSAILALAGHGSARSRLSLLAQDLGIANRVKFLGTLNKCDLAEAYQAADVFAIASTSESQSMVLLQAMSSGLPAVGARWRALPEYIDSDTGMLAEPGNSEEFATKLGALLEQPALRAQMGARASQRSKRYSISDITAKWEEIYNTTCMTASGISLCNKGAQP